MTRRGRAKQRRRGGVPDWVWGLGLGLIVVIAVGGFFFITESGGDDGGTCDQELPPLGSSEISQSAFDEEDAALTRVISMLNVGDREGAQSAFFGPAHNFTHNVDPPVRQKDQALARQLCEAIVIVEEGFPLGLASSQLATGMQDVQNLIRDSAEALGYQRPG